MYKLIITSFIAIVLCMTETAAQPEAELKKTFPDAEAVFTRLDRHVNIELDKEGKVQASTQYSESITYLTENAVNMLSRGRIYHSSFNELKDWQAYTQSGNKKVKVTNITTNSSTQDYIFYDDGKSTNFDFAGSNKGSSRHIEYQLQHSDAHLLSPHYFDRYFPVLRGELRVTFPSAIKMKYVIKGEQADKVKFSESRKKDKVTYTFSVENYTGIPDYPDAPDDSYYSTHVVFFIDEIVQNGTARKFLSSPADLYQYNYNFISHINKESSKELKELTDSLIRNAANDREKTASIYRWVQKNIKYVAFEDGLEGFIPREANLVCSRKYGDCKDMASILTAMLRHAGLEANFTWIGTRDLPYNYTETPLPIVDNHMICVVKLDGEYIFLDGTDEGCIYGLPPYNLQGKQALMAINEKEFKILTVPVIDKSENRLIDTTFLEVNGRDLKGKIKVLMNGYWASSLYSATHYRSQKENETYLKNRFQRGNNKIRFSNWQLHIAPDRNTALITADFELPDFASFSGEEMYMNLNLFKWYEHQEIDFPKRKSPIEHSYLEQSSYTTVLNLPEGYEASYLPQSHQYKNDVWGYNLQYKQKDRQVIFSQQFDTDYLMLYPNQFEQWNKVLEQLFPQYKQTIVISKK